MGTDQFLFLVGGGYLGNSSSLPAIIVLLTLGRHYVSMSGAVEERDEEGLMASCDGQFYVSS